MSTIICKVCGLEKPENEFRYDKRDSKYRQPCKMCDNKRRAESDKKTKTQNTDASNISLFVPEKRCAKCGEIKTANNFHKNKSKASGLHSYCKACEKHYQLEKRMMNDAPFDTSDDLIDRVVVKTKDKMSKYIAAKTVQVSITNEKVAEYIHAFCQLLNIPVPELIRIAIEGLFVNFQLAKITDPKLIDRLTPKRIGYR